MPGLGAGGKDAPNATRISEQIHGIIFLKKLVDCTRKRFHYRFVPSTEQKKYLPAVLLGRRAKGKKKNFSRAFRERLRKRMIAMNKERDYANAT